MVTSELGACEWFVWDLRRSNLIERGHLDQIVGEFFQSNPRAAPPALAEYLIGQEILTNFQAERLLQGKTQGFLLGPFTLMDALGSGSMGTVYKAHNKTDNQWYAVKVLPRRSMWNVRIARRKVRAFEQCKHPAVIPFVDVGTAGSMHYLAWPYAEGETLEQMVTRDGKLPAELVARLAMQIAEGLEVCHAQSLFHGILKPSNLMVNAQRQVAILDFGIGCLLAETEGESLVDTMSTANSVSSGLDCSSPESIMDPTNLTPTGDQYSLGCVMYYLLSGRYPFADGSAAEKMMAHQFKKPQAICELAPETPPELIQVIERLMQKKPEDRYGSAREVVETLRPLVKRASGVIPRPPSMKAAPPAVKPVQAPQMDASPVATAAPKPQSVTLSMQAPRPQSMNALPTRTSLKNLPAAKPVSPSVVAAPEKPRASVTIPGGADGGEETALLEDRMGPVGLFVTGVAACALVYGAAVWLKLF